MCPFDPNRSGWFDPVPPQRNPEKQVIVVLVILIMAVLCVALFLAIR
jgi:hypothetical protein